MILNIINGVEVPPAVNGIASELDVVQAIRAASAAGEGWAGRAPSSRVSIVRGWIDAVERSADDLAAIEAEGSGIDLDLARRDLNLAVVDARAACDTGANLSLGVVGVITARALVSRTILTRVTQLLVGGNTVVVKPSSRNAAIAAALGRLTTHVELPPGVINVVFGPGETIGRFMCAHPGIAAVAFTGRTETGRRVAVATAEHLKTVSLGLGAKNAAIVLKDADLERAVPCLVRAAFGRGGVDPFGLSKILVAREIASEFLERLRSAAPGQIHLPTDADVTNFARVLELARAENGGVSGGEIKGMVVNPAVVSELTHCSTIHQDELLVPLVTVNEIKYAHEGTKWANVSPFGRAAAIFTANEALARKLAAQLSVGTVWINGWFDDASTRVIGDDLKDSSFGFTFRPTFGQRAPVVIA